MGSGESTKIQQKQIEKEQQQQQNEHEEKMKKMENEQRNIEKNRIDVVLAETNNKIEKNHEKIKEIKKNKAEKTQALEINKDKIKNFQKYKEDKLQEFSIEIEYDECKTNLESNEKKIQEAIEKVGVNESAVGNFLQLAHDLTSAALVASEYNNKLAAKLDVFAEILNRECNDKLGIEVYFSDNKLEKIAGILKENEFEYLQDLVCESKEEYDEILEMVTEGLKEKAQEEEDEKKKEKMIKLNLLQKKKI